LDKRENNKLKRKVLKMNFNEKDLSGLFTALKFAAEKHKNQRRKNAEATPYINHPLEVAKLLVDVGKVFDLDIIKGAILHDTIEDTETTQQALIELFGKSVTSYVVEMSDDKSLPKEERKRLQIINSSHKSTGAKLIKLCDKISNITDVTNNPPGNWDLRRRKDYLNWAESVVAGLRGTNENLEKLFDDRLTEGRKFMHE